MPPTAKVFPRQLDLEAQSVAEHAPPSLLLPPGWQAALSAQLQQPYFQKLWSFVEAERQQHTVYPPPEQCFAALQQTPLEAVRVVILGQDPYHGPGQAHGLAFSVPPGVPLPPSLRNIFKELNSDLPLPDGAAAAPVPASGCLTGWARQGVLLLNTVLTVRAGAAASHKNQGWERFTDAVLEAVARRPSPAVFVLWGGPAQKKAALLEGTQHPILCAAHPSPLSAWNGFLGSRPFSKVNAALASLGQPPIDWRQTK